MNSSADCILRQFKRSNASLALYDIFACLFVVFSGSVLSVLVKEKRVCTRDQGNPPHAEFGDHSHDRYRRMKPNPDPWLTSVDDTM